MEDYKHSSAIAPHAVYTTFRIHVLSLKDITSSNYIPEALWMEVVIYFSVRIAINGRDYVMHPPLARALHNLDH